MSYEINVILGIENRWQSPIFMFFSTLFIYNLGFYRNILFEDSPQRQHAKWMKEHRSYWIFSLLFSLLFILYFYYSYSTEAQWFIGILSLISFLYINHDISFFNLKLSIRKIPFLKTIIVSIIWSLMTILPQIIESANTYDNSTLIQLVSWRFFFILPITLMFDIRDMQSDPFNLKTIPRSLGILNTKLLAGLSVCASFAIFVSLGLAVEIYYFIAIIYLLMILSITSSNVKKGELFYAGWFDGLMALHSIIIIFIF